MAMAAADTGEVVTEEEAAADMVGAAMAAVAADMAADRAGVAAIGGLPAIKSRAIHSRKDKNRCRKAPWRKAPKGERQPLLKN
jgi:hypothetical protein